ncbi:MAG: aminoglycoside 6-adenylyltransferase, partial [Anaerolineae bacterium]|nr:aminoglycoside 6-adenylyltransferase [Anaerolineae bacterium]
MNLTDYRNFTHTLLQNVQADPRVIGLVALGSMAEQNRTPDDWSDHDFFLVVQSGTQELFRQDTSWLPYADRIIMSIRETQHGLKVMYDMPHLIE